MHLFVLKFGKDPFSETYTNNKSAIYSNEVDFEWYFKDTTHYLFNTGVTSIQIWEYRADENMEMTLVNHRKALNLKKKPRILNPAEKSDVSKISQETKCPEGVAKPSHPAIGPDYQPSSLQYFGDVSTNF